MVGVGPGGPVDRTLRAVEAIRQAEIIVTYDGYAELVADLTVGKEIITTGMTREVERCRLALQKAAAGKTVALVCSGDAGVYGLAALAMELAEAERFDVPIEVVPGVTAALSAAALVGAPLTLDFAVVSLSDLLVPWAAIRRRLEAVAAAGMVVVLYNPASKTRREGLREAVGILLAHLPPQTPAAVATNVGRTGESATVCTLATLLDQAIDMRSVVIVGNRSSRIVAGKFITPRGYNINPD